LKGVNAMPEIDVTVTSNDVLEKYRFTIQIPYSLIENTNFLEVMEAYKITDPVGWLKALADFIMEITNDKN
jgi:hypothetical protein